MDAARRRLADELYAASREHDAAQADRLARFRNVEPETAELLGVLIRAAKARRILELGTSNGYSTIWLADAAQATGGRVLSVEVDAGRTELARTNLVAAGLGELVELRTEDAAATLAVRPTPSGTSCSSMPSARGTRIICPIWSERSPREGCWPSTTSAHTRTSWSSSQP